MHPQGFLKPNRTRFRGAESDQNPNLTRRHRSESEPGPAKPIRIRTSPAKLIGIRTLEGRNRSESELRKSNPNPGLEDHACQ